MFSILTVSKGQEEDFDKVFLLEMAEGALQSAVAQPKNCMDVMVAPEPNTNLTLEQNAKVRGPWCEVELQNDKDAKSKDAKNLVHLPEADDCSTVQVHVLVVDDNFIDRKIVERLVKSASFHVTAVDSGAKALEALSLNNHINLIITDYCMPEMCGYDLLKQVKGEPTSKDIPVVIMSSENVPNRIQSCLEEGAEEFLLKPVRLADVKRLRSYVSSSKHNTMEQHGVLWKKRKFNADGFQVQSPGRGPRLGSVTVV